MARHLALLLLSVLFSQAFCLQCNTCHGEYDCIGENVTCEDPSASCTTSIRKAYVSFLEFQSVRKGCARQLYPHESVSLNSHLMSLSYQARYCPHDNCNNETYFVSHPAPANHMRCHTCANHGAWCPEAARTQITCVGAEDQCVDLDVTGKLGLYSNVKIKGCTSLPRCDETLSFHSGTRTIHANCCSTPLCNTFTPDLHVLSQATNGLECFSCVDEDGSGSGCSSKAISTVKCTGIHTMCLEGIGSSRKGGKNSGLMTFKGCASPAMCQSSLLSLVQELDNTDIICCQGNLCNDRIMDGVVKEAKVPADTTDSLEDPECPAVLSAGGASDPDCVYSNEEVDDSILVVPPGSHTNKETSHTVNEKEDGENLIARDNTSPSPHHDHSETVTEHEDESNLSSTSSDIHGDSSTVATDNTTAGGSLTTTILPSNDSGPSTTSSGNHGNVVVLVPIVVPKKNSTSTSTAGTTSSSADTTNHKEVLAASNSHDGSDVSEYEECEAEDEDTSHGESLATLKESSHDGSASRNPNVIFHENATPGNTEGSHSGHGTTAGHTNPEHAHTGHGTNGEYFTADGGSTGRTPDGTASQPGQDSSSSYLDELANTILPIPYVITKDNKTFVVQGMVEADTPAGSSTNTPSSPSSSGESVLISGNGPSSKPKNKIPCKRPRPQGRPATNLAAMPGAEARTVEEGVVRNATTVLSNSPSKPERNVGGKVNLEGGKVNPHSGTSGLITNFGFFSFTLLLSALLH